jgi:hypothetical protein
MADDSASNETAVSAECLTRRSGLSVAREGGALVRLFLTFRSASDLTVEARSRGPEVLSSEVDEHYSAQRFCSQ